MGGAESDLSVLRKPFTHQFQVFRKDIYKVINRPNLVISSKASKNIYMRSHEEACCHTDKANSRSHIILGVCVCVKERGRGSSKIDRENNLTW